jgi:hypothetical protein
LLKSKWPKIASEFDILSIILLKYTEISFILTNRIASDRVMGSFLKIFGMDSLINGVNYKGSTSIFEKMSISLIKTELII